MQWGTVTMSCRIALTYRQVTTINCKHADRYSDNKLQSWVDRQIMTKSRRHAVRYSDKKLQRCIDLQASNANKLQTFSEIQ